MAGPVADKPEAGVIYAPSYKENVYQGAHGNESVVEGFVELNGVAANTEVHLLRLPIGMRINAVQLVTGDLGAGVTITVKSGDHELISNEDVHAAVARTGPSAYDIWKSQQPDGTDTSTVAYLAFQEGKKGDKGDKGDTGDGITTVKTDGITLKGDGVVTPLAMNISASGYPGVGDYVIAWDMGNPEYNFFGYKVPGSQLRQTALSFGDNGTAYASKHTYLTFSGTFIGTGYFYTNNVGLFRRVA